MASEFRRTRCRTSSNASTGRKRLDHADPKGSGWVYRWLKRCAVRMGAQLRSKVPKDRELPSPSGFPERMYRGRQQMAGGRPCPARTPSTLTSNTILSLRHSGAHVLSRSAHFTAAKRASLFGVCAFHSSRICSAVFSIWPLSSPGL